jgi:hypothetical protein
MISSPAWEWALTTFTSKRGWRESNRRSSPPAYPLPPITPVFIVHIIKQI